MEIYRPPQRPVSAFGRISYGSRIPREPHSAAIDSMLRDSDAMLPIAMKDISIVSKPVIIRRRRFQRGSLQKRKSGGCWNWIAFWWEDHHRKSQILGPCSTMTRPEALSEMARVLRPVNDRAGEPITRVWIVGDWIRDAFLPFIRRKWKLSTACTSGDRIRKHLITDFESVKLPSVTRDLLQRYLEQKAAAGLSFSLVDHLRWDLRAIFRLAVQDRA